MCTPDAMSRGDCVNVYINENLTTESFHRKTESDATSLKSTLDDQWKK